MDTSLFTDPQTGAIIEKLARETGSPVLGRLTSAKAIYAESVRSIEGRRAGLAQRYEAAQAALADAERRLDATRAEAAGLREAIAKISTDNLAADAAAQAGVTAEDIEKGHAAVKQFRAFVASLPSVR